jgi:prevent-host-death family protein
MPRPPDPEYARNLIERPIKNTGIRYDQLDQVVEREYIASKETAMGEPINIYEAKANLSRLVERAAAGEEIVIAKAGKPRARLVPLPTQKPEVVYGAWAGQVTMADDFNDPLPDDLQHAFDGGGA